jgi:outer membrane immunogenic protein
MKKITHALLGMAALGATTAATVSSAQAQYNWSGFYIGANAGYMMADTDWRFTAPANSTAHTSVDWDSGVLGGHVGLQHQWGSIVVGLEVAGSSTSAFNKGRESSNCSFPAPFDDRCDVRNISSLWTAGARLGWAPSSQWLLFLSGGYAQGHIDTAIRFGGVGVPPPANALPVTSSNTRNDGWYIGAGVEWAVSRNWIFGVEYQHIALDDKGHCVGGDCTIPSILNRNVDADIDIVRARLSFKFGRDEPVPLK